MRIALALLISVFMAGCSPDYNWREMSVGDGVRAFFPDRPQTETRSLDYAGVPVSFSMTTAEVDKTLFSIAFAPFPSDWQTDPALQREFALAAVQSLYRNLGAAPPSALPEKAFVVEGQPQQDEAMRLQARVWLTPSAFVEALVMAPAARFPQDEANQFLEGVEIPSAHRAITPP